ncbi:hypothetical protein PL329_14820 [Escherichia coli]|nr:hypothetical protein [Escherichia coli]WCE52307.1 hypothetical protein PL329_14820 [Escherichia coli]
MTITVKGVAAGKVNIPVVSGNGELAAVAEITVTGARQFNPGSQRCS